MELVGFDGTVQEDKDNCTVRALSHCTNLPIFKAYKIAKASGRPDMTAWYAEFVVAEANNEGFWFQNIIDVEDFKSITLEKFARENPVGKFYVVVTGHAIAVINGKLVEKYPETKRKVLQAWRYLE